MFRVKSNLRISPTLKRWHGDCCSCWKMQKCSVSHTTELVLSSWWKFSSVLEAENSSCQNFKKNKRWPSKLQPWLISYSHTQSRLETGQCKPVEYKGVKRLAQGYHKGRFWNGTRSLCLIRLSWLVQQFHLLLPAIGYCSPNTVIFIFQVTLSC